jgi:hypothetical protein
VSDFGYLYARRAAMFLVHTPWLTTRPL